MSSNPYINYYINQAGSGISGFEGIRFQRGQGFFGNIFRNAILPLLKYLGPKILSTGSEIASDVIGGENVLESIKTRGKARAQGIAGDAAARAMKFAQTGQGRKRRRRSNNLYKAKRIRKKISSKRIAKRRGGRKSKRISTNKPGFPTIF